jgi:hypothetical protein
LNWDQPLGNAISENNKTRSVSDFKGVLWLLQFQDRTRGGNWCLLRWKGLLGCDGNWFWEIIVLPGLAKQSIAGFEH